MAHDSPDQKATNSSRRNFLKLGAGVVAGAAVAAGVVDIPLVGAKPSSNAASLQDELSSTKSKLTGATALVSTLHDQLAATQGQLSTTEKATRKAQAQATDLQTQIDMTRGFLTLAVTEQILVESIAETLIPSDGNGPGAKEAGVIYFIDRQLATDYGKNGNMYMQGPFVMPNQTNPITVDGITYSGGSTEVSLVSGMQYQYHMSLREFWRYGLQAFEAYCNSAYGGNFESLSANDQVQALTDIFNNKPTSFNDIVPADFYQEIFFMTWCGYFTDPLHGGNIDMAAWSFAGFNGLNQGNFYGEGHTGKQLMVATTPTRLQPVSLAQFEKGSP